MTIRVLGQEGLLAQLREIGDELAQRTIGRAARKAFKPVLESARAKVPVDSGALRDSLAIASVKPKGTETVFAVGIVVKSAKGAGNPGELPPSRRWHFPELGTAKKAAQPYLRPAIDEEAQGVVDAFGVEVWKGILRALKKGGR